MAALVGAAVGCTQSELPIGAIGGIHHASQVHVDDLRAVIADREEIGTVELDLHRFGPGAEGDGSFANDSVVPAHLDGRGYGGAGRLEEADGQAIAGNHGGRAACGATADQTVVEAGPACGGTEGGIVGDGVVERGGERAGATGAQLGQDERAVGAGRGRIQHARTAGDLGGTSQRPAVWQGGEITRSKGLLAHGERWRATGRSGERPGHSPSETRRRLTGENGSGMGGRQGEQADRQVTEQNRLRPR